MRDVRAEHPAVGVALVDDDVGDPAQRARPLLVRRQDPAMEHVGVGDDPAGVPPHPVALLAGGVPVVGSRAHGGVGERGDRGQLVAGQGLRRGEVQDARPRVLGEPGERGELVGQRLARRGTGRHDDVAAVAGQLCRLDLVPPRHHDAPLLQPGAQGRAHPVRPAEGGAVADRDVVHVGDRPLLLVGPGEHRREQLGARRYGVRAGARGGPERVERRHGTTVTPSCDRRRPGIPRV